MWKECVRKLVEELERLTGLLLHVSELPAVDFYSPELRDNHNMKNIGKGLGTEQPGGKEGARKRMLNRLEENGELSMWIDDTGGYKVVLVLGYARLVNEWLKVCSVLIVFTCGMAGRGYEMLSIRYYNSRVSRRNIVIDNGQVKIIIEYHKSMGIMDEVKVYCHRMNYSNQVAHPKIPTISHWMLSLSISKRHHTISGDD
jgi:hypothetical protein